VSPKLRADLVHAVGDLDALMSVQQVRHFFGGVSKMSLYRWARNREFGFPQPFKVGQKNYWIRREILAFRDAQRARSLRPEIGATSPNPEA
jgi:predicted DNA-binding transcriptional regulator AlpA